MAQVNYSMPWNGYPCYASNKLIRNKIIAQLQSKQKDQAK